MTTCTWDKNEVSNKFATCTTLKDVIVSIEQEFSLRGEVICEIRVNGMLLRDDDEARFAASRVDEISTLSIATENPQDLIMEALGSSQDYLQKVRNACVKTSELLRGTDQHRAQLSFLETVEGCQWLVDTIMSIRGASEGIGASLVDRNGWLAAEQTFTKVVTDVLSAFQKHDYILVADILEYDLNNSLEIWHEVLCSESRGNAA